LEALNPRNPPKVLNQGSKVPRNFLEFPIPFLGWALENGTTGKVPELAQINQGKFGELDLEG